MSTLKVHLIVGNKWNPRAACGHGRGRQSFFDGVLIAEKHLVTCAKCLSKIQEMEARKKTDTEGRNPPISKAEQMVRSRMMEIRDLVRSGATEMVGKSYRGASGKIEGRHKGGFTKMFPELNRAGLTPGEAAKAVALGKGKRYARLHKAIADTLGVTIRSPRKRGPLKVVPHAGIQSCRHCRQLHTTSEHRFHGPGAFHRTHAFAFNPKKMKKNPTSAVVIYGKVLRIEAQKTQKHRCDDECAKFKHRYYHDFKKGPIMYGLPDGSLLIKARK